MPDPKLTKVVAEFEVVEKLAPQLVDILRAVPAQFPCKFVEPEAAPQAEKPAEPTKKPGLVKRILGKGK